MRIYILLLLSFISLALALNNGLGLTPQMGWNSWNAFFCDVDEHKIKTTIDAMVVFDLPRYGYQYVNIDDCWSEGRDKNGVLIPDQKTFPGGIASLAKYAHDHNLKLGIYSDSGWFTCAGRPGSYGFESIDAKTWAAWGVDYLKYDNCYTNVSLGVKERNTVMSHALTSVDRPIFFSLCEWGVEAPWYWAQNVGNSWRTTEDITNNWDHVLQIIDLSIGLAQYAGPGAWNDIDMLEVGNGGMSFQQYQIHFAFWCLLKAPLILGFDLTQNMTPDILDLITNTELIAINQDKLGVQGDLVKQVGPIQIWAAPLEDGSRAFIVFNRRNDQSVTVDFSSFGYSSNTTAVVRDILNRKDIGTFHGKYTLTINTNNAFVGRVTPSEIKSSYKNWRPWNKC